MKPLVILEDSDEDFAAIYDALQRAEVTNPILRLSDGELCLELLLAPTKRRLDPCLLLLDLNLPGMDGRSVLVELKEHATLCMLPVVIFTTSANPSDVTACYRAGANSYHIKPLDVPTFRQVIYDIARYWLNEAILP